MNTKLTGMKQWLLLFMLLPFAAAAQKLKMNEFDKYIKQRHIEFEPLTVFNSPKAKVSLSLKCIGSEFFLTISGWGWGVSTISGDSEAILLLANDSTVVVKSTGTQMYDISSVVNTYKHQYSISLKDVEALTRHDLVGIRKYNIQDFADLDVPPQYGPNVKKLGAMFIDELYKGKVLLALQHINANDVAKHIGDSVRLCTKITSTSYYEMAVDKPTFLNAGSGSNHLFSAVIWEQDRPNFNRAPEIHYADKDVCLYGVVQVYQGKPQIILRNREQIVIQTPIAAEDAAKYVGDSVTVYGTVASGQYFAESENEPTILNIGAPFPDHLLSVVISGADRANFTEAPESFYTNKNIGVTGKVILNNGKPQIVLRHKNQVRVIKTDAIAFASTKSTQSTKAPVKKEPVNTKAEFPGGKAALMTFIKQNLRRIEGLEAGEKRTVVARFLLKPDGTPSEFEIKESGGARFDAEVLRILKKMPKWSPEIVNSQPATIYITIPVTFEHVEEASVLNVPGAE